MFTSTTVLVLSFLLLVPIVAGWAVVLLPLIAAVVAPFIILFHCSLELFKYLQFIYHQNDFHFFKLKNKGDRSVNVKLSDYFPNLVLESNSFSMSRPLMCNFKVGEKLNAAQNLLPDGFSFLITKNYFGKGKLIFQSLFAEDNLQQLNLKIRFRDFLFENQSKLSRNAEQIQLENKIFIDALTAAGFTYYRRYWILS